MKFNRQLRPATETSLVVSYGGKTIPSWRTAAILKINISPYLSEKSSDFHEILYIAADFELGERHVIKNEISKIQDGRRPPFWKSLYRHISANKKLSCRREAARCFVFVYSQLQHAYSTVFSQPSIYIDGWLYGMSMTSVVCNVPVLSQNDSTYHHSVFTTWKWHPFATWTPSFIILVWGHHPLIGATVFPASRTLVKRRTVTP